MGITTVLFDLDGTLLPMDQMRFVDVYLRLLCEKLAPLGYEPQALGQAVWQGTKAMMKNTGEKTNETVFWDTFCGLLGEHCRNDQPVFREFYENEFSGVSQVCDCTPKAAETIALVKSRGFRTALATPPLFPAAATRQRITWAGLDPADFDLITTYENSSHSKPNPDYYREILERMELEPKDCMMVGNDVDEDMIAGDLGMKTFLLTDCLINKYNADIRSYPQGSFPELMAFIGGLR